MLIKYTHSSESGKFAAGGSKITSVLTGLEWLREKSLVLKRLAFDGSESATRWKSFKSVMGRMG